MSQERISPLVSAIGFNDGANKGFWRIQPRDRVGQWMEMGGEASFYYRDDKGKWQVGSGAYVGPTGSPGMARIARRNDAGTDFEDVTEVPSHLIFQPKARLSRDFLERSGIDPEKTAGTDIFGNPISLKGVEIPRLSDLKRSELTDEDLRLAEGRLTPEEREAEAAGRAESPLAKLPGGFESLNQEEAKQLLRESGVDPDEFSAPAKKEESDRLNPALEEGAKRMEAILQDMYKGRTAEDVLEGRDAPAGYTSDPFVENAGFRPFDGSGRIPSDVRRENARKAKDRSLLERSLGRQLTPEEISDLGLEQTDTAPFLNGNIPGDFRMQDAASASKAKKESEAKTKTAREALAAELEGKKASDTPNKVFSEAKLAKALDTLFADDTLRADVDAILDESAPDAPVMKKVSELQNGDIIMAKGQPTYRVVSNDTVTKGGREIREIRVQDPSGRVATLPEAVANDPGEIEIASFTKPDVEPRRPRQPQPEAPKPEAEAPTPTPTPEGEAPKPEKGKGKGKGAGKPVRKPKSEKTNLPNRKDDGGDVAPVDKPVEELRNKKINNIVDQFGKLVKIIKEKVGKDGEVVQTEKPMEDPNAIIDALLEENPNAKIKEDGSIVMERGKFTDGDGKEYGYEVSVQRTVGNQFVERYMITAPESGETLYDFYNADYKDSFTGLYGKTNGLTVTRDYLLGRDVPGNKGVDEDGVPIDRELRSYFGPNKTIENRLKYLRKTKNMNNWRLLTLDENIERFLAGRSRELNKSDVAGDRYRSQFGNVRRSFIASIFEAIDLEDNELVQERLVQTLGRLPDNPASVQVLLDALRRQITQRYKGTPRYRELLHLPGSLERWLIAEDKDLRDIAKIPFVSEDGVSVIRPGMKVRFISNEGDMAVGTVVKLNAGSGAIGGYKDTARVKFGNKTVDNLQTRNMLIQEDDAEATEYKPWVRNEEKLRRRAAELGIDFEEYMRRREDNPDYDPEGDEYAGIDAGSPYLGEEGQEGDQPETPRASVETLEPGDAFYDEEGQYAGTVIDVVEVPATDGSGTAIAVTYLTADGEEVVEIVERGEGRGPK